MGGAARARLLSSFMHLSGPSRVIKFLYAPERPEQGGYVPLCPCSSTPSVWALKPPTWSLVHKTTYAPMIYTALCIMFRMCAYPLLGQLGEGWALEISSFLGPKWHSPIGSMPFDMAQKTLDIQDPTPSHLPSQWICTHPKHYARGCINHRCIDRYYFA